VLTRTQSKSIEILIFTISNNNDAETLQKDLDKLGHWENEWCMKFHPDKCTVLRVTIEQKENN
jgi:hypothetical protein